MNHRQLSTILVKINCRNDQSWGKVQKGNDSNSTSNFIQIITTQADVSVTKILFAIQAPAYSCSDCQQSEEGSQGISLTENEIMQSL